jgi:hypothetical protein
MEIVFRNAVGGELHLDYYGWGSNREDHQRPKYCAHGTRGWFWHLAAPFSTFSTARHILGFAVSAFVSQHRGV